MPKRTIKYVKGLAVAEFLGIIEVDEQEILYSLLNEQGFFWDSDTKVWAESDGLPNPPTQLLHIRVWTDSTKVRKAAEQVKTVLQSSGYQLLEQSQPYACRPPKQLESRIYLTFKQEG